jgi:nitroreductase
MEKTQAIRVSTHDIKKAKTKHGVHEIIQNRWSARAFSDQMIHRDALETLVEAAAWSPSSMNEQPWRYIVTQKGTEAFDKMVSCLSPGNLIWAQQAPVLILSLAELNHASGNLNGYAMYDTGAANQSMLIQAAAMGILGHLMGGFDGVKAQLLFNIPESQKVVVIIALGYPTEAEYLPEPFKTREQTPRTRKPIEDIATFIEA